MSNASQHETTFMLKLLTVSNIAAALLLSACFANTASVSNNDNDTSKDNTTLQVKSVSSGAPKIQAAILLDVSNSMDGLIDQAKAQLWNMVSVMGKAKCDGVTPQIEIALYEYGRPTNDVNKGFVKQISPFTKDLDQLSKDLFSLTTNGGDEYCGHVMYSSLSELGWDTASANYKVIFIAGNEDFLQGDIVYTKACAIAKKEGVIINTIYCGNRMQGIQEHWNIMGECGGGSFTNINADIKVEDIPTPYDSVLFSLNDKLNGTYISYGSRGGEGYLKLQEADNSNFVANKSAALKRVSVKSKKVLYDNSSWDLVDAYSSDSAVITKIDAKTLPDSLKNKSKVELQLLVNKKAGERTAVQKQIETVNAQREIFIANASKNNNGKEPNLQTEIEKIIRSQAAKYNMVIE